MRDALSQAAGVFVVSAGLCLLAGRATIRRLARAQMVQPLRHGDCPPLQELHAHKAGTPTMGGVLVLAAAAVAAACGGGLRHADGWIVLGSVAALAALGLLDDVLKLRRPQALGVRTAPKLAVALGVGAAVGAALAVGPAERAAVALPWSGRAAALGPLCVPFAMLVMAASAHAVNLTDGMDGLAAGCGTVAFAALAVWLLLDPAADRRLLPWCAAFAGACAGFLWFNGYPASVFLGDVGALGLGAALGAIALLSQAALWFVVVGGVFVAEAGSVIVQVASYRWRGGRRVFRVAPLHHHFQLGGTPEPKLMVRFWIAGALLASAGVATAGWWP
ncbi:MAG TPA: phospho-N-acetylmuramoyl-pentapeptide-transferase [bacterium]